MSDRDYKAPDSSATVNRAMTRCGNCQAWWSVHPDDPNRRNCPCGGVLMVIDMDRYIQTLPKKAYDLTRDDRGKKT
jgi:hypothetical protein